MPCGREIRLRRVKSLRRWGIYFISLDAKHQISQFAEQIISPWAKRTISLFVKIKCFEYWTRSVSRGAEAPTEPAGETKSLCPCQKKALAFASAFFNEINPFRDFWNALRRVKSLRRWGIYFISLDAKHQISQFAEQIISPWAKRTISLFVWIKRFEYWARSVSRLGAPRCLRQMKRCSEQEDTTSIAKRSTVLGCSISFFSAFGENSFITHLVLSPKNVSILGYPLQGNYVSDRKGRWFESNMGQK